MKFNEEYQKISNALMKANITYKLDTVNELIRINDDVYVRVDEGWDDEPVAYGVGARLRESTFELDEIEGIIAFIKQEMD